MTSEALAKLTRTARLRLLQMHYESRVGHIGGNLSCIDILITLFHKVMGAGDRFVLSKGHAAGALYVTLWTLGRLSDAELSTFHKEGTRLSGHPAPNTIDEIIFATGSLGHGLSLSNGLALAKELQGRAGRIYCLMSDGECQEGSTWEAVIFAAHRQLPITAIVDANGLQGFGSTKEIAGMEPIGQRLAGFGCELVEIDGHDAEAIAKACEPRPGFRVVIARTKKGSGVSFMENKMEWHYLPLSDALYAQAVGEITDEKRAL